MLPAIGYEYKDQPAEVILNEDGAPLFNPQDIGRGLEIGNDAVRKAVQNMKDGIHKVHLTKERIINSGGNLIPGKDIPTNGRYYVTEAGLYRLIMQSRKPEAEEFKDWIACDVLPSIRKRGYYGTPPAQQFQVPQTLGEALQLAADQQKQIEAQEKRIRLDAPKMQSTEGYGLQSRSEPYRGYANRPSALRVSGEQYPAGCPPHPAVSGPKAKRVKGTKSKA